MDPVISENLSRAEACWITALGRVNILDLDRRSGCTDWTNRELINHLVGGGLRYAKLLAQAPPAEVESTRGVDHLGGDMMAAFWTHERAFRRLADECDLSADVPHRIGAISGHQLVRMRILELTLHAADLSVGTGDEWPIEDSLAEFIDTQLSELIVRLGSDGGYASARSRDGAVSAAQRVLQVSGR